MDDDGNILGGNDYDTDFQVPVESENDGSDHEDAEEVLGTELQGKLNHPSKSRFIDPSQQGRSGHFRFMSKC